MNQNRVTSHRPSHEHPASGGGAFGRSIEHARRPRPWSSQAAWILIAALAGLAAGGCGKSKTESTPAAEVVSQERVVDPAVQASQTPSDSAQSHAAGAQGAGTREGDAMPPEIAASAPDSALAPGAIVEITARATTDVAEMTLRDDLGQQQPFAYDAASMRWHARYRIPLRVHGDRVALSVTARNAAGLWRRAWVSLAIKDEAN